MAGDKKRRSTLSMENIPLGNPTADHSEIVYDRADLAKTPLAKLVGLSGIVIGQKNLFEGFSSQIRESLRRLDEDYRFKLNRYQRYVGIVGTGTTGKAAEFRDAAKEDLAQCREIITEVLAEQFKSVFEFLIENLEDERLDKLGMGVSQKKVAAILYDHLDYYEDLYAIGKGATVIVLQFARQKAEEKGERIVRNIERDEMDIRLLQDKFSTATEGFTTFPGVGEPKGPPSKVSPFKATLPPPAFKPDSKLPPAPSSKLPPVKAPEGFLPPPPSLKRQAPVIAGTLPPEPFIPDPNLPSAAATKSTPQENQGRLDRYISGQTMPFRPGAIVPGSYEDSIVKQAGEVLHDVDLRSSKLPQIPGYDTESLSSEDAEVTATMSDMSGRVLQSILDDEAEGYDTPVSPVIIPAPIAPRSFSSAEVPGVVAGLSVSYGPGVTIPLPAGAEVKNEARVVVETGAQSENLSREQLETAPTQPEIVREDLMKIDAPAEEDEKTLITERRQILPPKPGSWWSRKKEAISTWYTEKKTAVSNFITAAKASASKLYSEAKSGAANLYKSVKNWVMPKARKVLKPIAVVAGLTAFGAVGVGDYHYNAKKTESAESAKLPTPPVAPSVASAASSASETPKNVDAKPVDLNKASDVKVAEAPIFTPTFSNVLLHSKSPLVQQIIKEGKLTIGSEPIADSVIGAMQGLTTDAQKVQVAELQQQINLGLGVFFNEHFGTPAKIAESMKDPNLRNLYRTAKHAQEKGWFASYHTKERFPQAYLLATQLLTDAHELGQDASDNPDPKVKAYVQGNMFQAKMPGSTINLRKANGHYEVVAEYMMGILEGKNVKDMMKVEFAAAAGKEKAGSFDAPVDTPNSPVDQPANAPKVEDKNGGKQGTILPNIIGPRSLFESVGDGVDSIDGVDSGWDALMEKADKISADKAAFEKSGALEFDLPLSMTTRQENEAILPTVIEKVIALNPQADAAAITKLMKRYGFIGIKSWSRTKPGHFKIEMSPNFLKILKPQLNKVS